MDVWFSCDVVRVFVPVVARVSGLVLVCPCESGRCHSDAHCVCSSGATLWCECARSSLQMLERVCGLTWCLLFDVTADTDTQHGLLVRVGRFPQRAGTWALSCRKDRSQLQVLWMTRASCSSSTTSGITTVINLHLRVDPILLIQSNRQSAPQNFIFWVNSCECLFFLPHEP